ncbi:hypothetical protein [Pseudomonas extremaustralis]|uniref:hypothetical protein n=1 Tax=Pseudomonas extremaustralis TaxID=359110 RepID=UPI0028665C2A|nr:hypothetical protein [Pseudomonas extremaustralis]MDR6577848.1 hypothetical protein [Pseudomonas extremaustralis]
MLNTLDVNFHGKRHTDFDLLRVLKAEAQGFDKGGERHLWQVVAGQCVSGCMLHLMPTR